MDNFDDDDNEIMDAEDREIANEEIDEDLIKLSMMNSHQDMSDQEEDGPEEEEGDSNNNDKTNRDNGKFPEIGKHSLPPQLNPFMFPFLPNSNVVLEPISATQAAVAQFAENNMSPTDNNVLQSTLYNLQQQQILQLQLIHQLQQQIVLGMHPLPGNPLPMLPSSLPSSMMPRPTKFDDADDDDLPMKLTTKDKIEDEEEETPRKEEEPEKENKKSEAETVAKETETQSSTTASSSPSVPSAFPLPSSSMTSTPPATSEFAKLTKLVERSQYVSEDPFFRHKCRLCHKVFGSDSALQIHIRSHTGERPFKCNICGNRFTTRGNLKVHFERHKAKYPHVKMNPHPVPEHLDKLPHMPSMLGSSFPSSVPPPMHLQNRMINSTPPMSISSMMSSIYPGSAFGPRPQIPPFSRATEERRSPNPTAISSPTTSPTLPQNEAQSKKIKDDDAANLATSPNSISKDAVSPTQKSETATSPKFHNPLSSALPHMSTASPFPMLSHIPPEVPPPMLSSSLPMGPSSRDSILPTKMISHDDNLEKYMEIDRSETSKLQQLVDNIEKKVSDPNQCVICHRVLSCKSALQMHYRIHTGERPYKCKICGRAFTTKGNLKTHMGVHRMKPPIRMMHQCPICHKSFTNLLVLQQHVRSHASLPGMPAVPEFGPLKEMPFRSFPPHLNWPPRPLDFSFRDDNERELDLRKPSRKSESLDEKDDDSRDDFYDKDEQMDVDDQEEERKSKRR
ncbi:hypothetical protein FSP39_013584 [Pinctada imbricata]|uniref:Homeotic protein spalt-major n=1 Tax=Pinctada imbricata TaxID=66713 RepID=A0AA88XIX0_PINIB|nr:hypothetical protein FSP39_013584 [Pinctada imbricata]